MTLRMSFLAMALALMLLTPIAARAADTVGPKVEIKLSETSIVPGQSLTLEVIVLVPTWMPVPPELPSFEIPNVVVRLPVDSSNAISKQVDGQTWAGISRTYQLFPMTVGHFVITPQPISVTYAHPDSRTPVVAQVSTNPVEFSSAMPDGAENLKPFIAARGFEVSQNISANDGLLMPGDAVEWTVTATIDGSPSLFIPPLTGQVSGDGFLAYPKEPIATDDWSGPSPRGTRVETTTFLAEGRGRLVLPAMTIRWFNLNTMKVETIELEPAEFRSDGEVVTSSEKFEWQTITAWVLGIVCLLVALSWSGPKVWLAFKAWRRKKTADYLASEAYAFSQVMAAVKQRDFGSTYQELSNWKQKFDDLAELNSRDVDDVLVQVGSLRYGQGEAVGSGDDPWVELSRSLLSLRNATLKRSGQARSTIGLPPLNPGGSLKS